MNCLMKVSAVDHDPPSNFIAILIRGTAQKPMATQTKQECSEKTDQPYARGCGLFTVPAACCVSLLWKPQFLIQNEGRKTPIKRFGILPSSFWSTE